MDDVVIIDEHTLRDKIYEVRGVKVMLDFELAEIYGYATKAFNQQIKRNIDRFPDDFMFQLSREELDDLVRSQFVTSRKTPFLGQSGGVRYLPYAFTEQGIYMLMTVLKGELAVEQSKALIRTFKDMKDYIIENQDMIGQHDFLKLSLFVTENFKENAVIRKELTELGNQMNEVMDRLSTVVDRSEIAPFLLDLGKPAEKREYLWYKKQPAKADVTLIDIYSQAKQSIHIIDDYISIKTLYLLQDVGEGVNITIFSDNKFNKLHAIDYCDFRSEFPHIKVQFIKTKGKSHDRFIILDFDTPEERVFHCGPSLKDAGKRISAITEHTDKMIKDCLNNAIKDMLGNPPLKLK